MVDNHKQEAHASPERCPIAIIGSGPVGLLAALTLAPYYEKLVLIGPHTPLEDGRTSALMMPAINLLESLGIWEAIRAEAAPLSRLRILDATSRLLRAPTVTFHASEIGEAAFGYNIPNKVLNTALRETVEATPHIIWHKSKVEHYQHEASHVTIRLDDKTCYQANLIIAADGRHSPARAAAGIGARQWHYPQMALVLNFAHQLPHQDSSHEFHTAHGPFTQVPLLGQRSSLVWVCHPQEAKRLAGLGRESLATEIEKQMGSMLGKITLEQFPKNVTRFSDKNCSKPQEREQEQDWSPQIWPLSGMGLSHFSANRTLLMGEAAHVFPPIGAQGLNLGFRDITDLLFLLRDGLEDRDSANICEQYNRRRRADIWGRTGFVHALNRTLLADFLPLQLIRSAGLEALRQCPPLRSWLMREGLRPGSGLQALLPASPFPKSVKNL